MESHLRLWRGLPDQHEPVGLSKQVPTLSRRHFLQLSAAAAALAGSACSGPPAEPMVPYASRPESRLGTNPQFFATAMTLGGYGQGLLVQSTDGRPTKVEGNPRHPASLGATDVFAQASILDLWDPARAQQVQHLNQPETWERFHAALRERLQLADEQHGEGLRILSGPVSSPTFAAQLEAVRRRYPVARWHQWESLHEDGARAGSRLAFGRHVDTLYHFDVADVIVQIGGDFLTEPAGRLRYAREFSSRRKVTDTGAPMNRLYVAESTPSLAGAVADHRLALPATVLEPWLAQLAASLRGDAPEDRRLHAIANDLLSHRGRSLIVGGRALSAESHALIHRLNAELAAVGNTCSYLDPVLVEPTDCTASLRELSEAMHRGQVQTLIIIGGNPAYDAPADLDFAAALGRVPFSAHLSVHGNETSARCRWQLPQTHYLEQWGDTRADDGTVSIVQPLIAPLYAGRSVHELLALLLGSSASAYESVRQLWTQTHGRTGFDAFWNKALREGIIDGSAQPTVTAEARALHLPSRAPGKDWTVLLTSDASTRDGEFAGNAWLQELPRPDSKLTWDNAAMLSPGSARALDVVTGDRISIATAERQIEAPVWVLPGQGDHTVTLSLGYGRTVAGAVGAGVGFDAYALRTASNPWLIEGARIAKAKGRHDFATTQHHSSMEGREIVRTLTVQQMEKGERPDKADDQAPSLYQRWPYEGYRWGMAINLSACIGCNACTIACQAENNIPVVGKDQVARGREMHWIRVDRYYRGPEEWPETLFQPVPCMHCEDAPCELVCPVGATVHDSEGLNLQVYNRCVGTRFCSNNCPYKVRRFNFLQYSDDDPTHAAGRNPEVTVRQRGVMEKCSYCIQRIKRAEIYSQEQGRRIADGEVITACQAVCPTQAISFGDLNDVHSQVNEAKANPLNYALLGELNTRPRTSYLARLSNPDTAFEEPSS